MIRRPFARAAIASGMCGFAMCMASVAAQAAEVHVLATGALRAAFAQVVPAFERETGNHVDIEWGPSYGTSADALPTRIRAGEPMDVCFMIGAALTDHVKQGYFDPASRVDLMSSGIGVAVAPGVAKPSVVTVDDLRKTLLAAKSVAFSEGASGTYITQTLFERLGVAQQMKSKSVLIRGKELVGTALARGDAELGLQQISELRAISGIQYVGPLPAEVQKASVIAAAIGVHARERAAGQAFIDYLRTPEARALMAHSGLDPISK